MAESSVSFIKKFLGYSLVPWITFALAFISAPISTRIFAPDVLGKINIFYTYSNLIGLLLLFGLDQAYVRFYNERPKGRSVNYLFTICFAVTNTLIFVFGILSLPFANEISDFLFDEPDNLLLIFLYISVFCSSALRYFNLAYRMEQDIKSYTIQGVLIALVSKILYIISGFWDPSYKTALLVCSLGYLVLTIIFVIIQKNRFEKIKSIDNFFCKQILSFAGPLMPVSILSWVNTSIPQLIIQKTMDYYSIGIFTSAMSLANLIYVIQSGFNTFWVPYSYENYKTQNGQFFKVHRYLMCVLTLFALLIICSQDIIFVLLGEKYRAAKSFFPFLILGPICYIAGEVAGIGINISKKTYLKIYVFVASIIFNIASCLVLQHYLSIAGVAVATSVSAIVYLIVQTYNGEKYYKLVLNYKYMVYCIASIFICSFSCFIIEDSQTRFIISSAIFIISFAFYRSEIRDLVNIAIKFIKN